MQAVSALFQAKNSRTCPKQPLYEAATLLNFFHYVLPVLSFHLFQAGTFALYIYVPCLAALRTGSTSFTSRHDSGPSFGGQSWLSCNICQGSTLTVAPLAQTTRWEGGASRIQMTVAEGQVHSTDLPLHRW